MHSHPTSTMADSFFTHGLAGIDLHHAELQRAASIGSVRSSMPLVTRVRQAIANGFIAAGTMLAGDTPCDRVHTPGTHAPA